MSHACVCSIKRPCIRFRFGRFRSTGYKIHFKCQLSSASCRTMGCFKCSGVQSIRAEKNWKCWGSWGIFCDSEQTFTCPEYLLWWRSEFFSLKPFLSKIIVHLLKKWKIIYCFILTGKLWIWWLSRTSFLYSSINHSPRRNKESASTTSRRRCWFRSLEVIQFFFFEPIHDIPF